MRGLLYLGGSSPGVRAQNFNSVRNRPQRPVSVSWPFLWLCNQRPLLGGEDRSRARTRIGETRRL